MTYRLGFVPEALKEWRGLEAEVKPRLAKALTRRLEEPHVEGQGFHGLPGFYRIKLRRPGQGRVYMLVYLVKGDMVEVREVRASERERDLGEEG